MIVYTNKDDVRQWCLTNSVSVDKLSEQNRVSLELPDEYILLSQNGFTTRIKDLHDLTRCFLSISS